MKIKDNRVKPCLYMSDIKVGDPFMYNDAIYMKIDASKTITNRMFYGVDLENGSLEAIPSDVQVSAAKAEIVILREDA